MNVNNSTTCRVSDITGKHVCCTGLSEGSRPCDAGCGTVTGSESGLCWRCEIESNEGVTCDCGAWKMIAVILALALIALLVREVW